MTGRNTMQSPNKIIPAPKIIAAAIVSIAGLAWCQSLLTSERVNQLSFVSLVALVVLAGLFIAFSDRIKTLNLRQLSIDLERVEEARKDVEARAAEIRRITFSLAEITLFITAIEGRVRGEGEADVNTPWLESKVRELLHSASATPEEQSKTFRLFSAAKELDSLRDTLVGKEWVKRWNAIREQINDETKPMA